MAIHAVLLKQGAACAAKDNRASGSARTLLSWNRYAAGQAKAKMAKEVVGSETIRAG
jgi:hypothetical protein